MNNGRNSIQYADSYLDNSITELTSLSKVQLEHLKNNNINSIRDFTVLYNKLLGKDEPKDKPIYQYLSKMSIPFDIRRELISKIKYVYYMCK